MSLQPPCSDSLWNNWFERSLYFIFHIDCNGNTKMKSSKIKLWCIILVMRWLWGVIVTCLFRDRPSMVGVIPSLFPSQSFSLLKSFPHYQVTPSYSSSQIFPFICISPSHFTKSVLLIFWVRLSHVFEPVIRTFRIQFFEFFE